HKIRLDNLAPATRYFYRVCSQEIPDYRAYHKEFGHPVKSQFYSFRTIDPNTDSFKAAVFNDLHQFENTFNELRKNLDGEKLDFVVFNGDCVDDPRDHDQATYFISLLCEGVGADSIPVFFLRGNHEIRNAYSVGLRDHYDYVGGKSYGAFNWGDTRIVTLDCGEDKVDDTWVYYGLNDFTSFREEQVGFIKDEIAGRPFKKADKRIIIHHIPLYENSEKNLCADLWLPLLQKAPFDVSLNGHVHKFGYLPKGAVGNNYPVIKGGGYKLDVATVMILDKTKGRLNIRVLDVNGGELLNENF
ncbi:MAG: metallophosphoesterase, partial [Muribaculaceae bacterium]|nr:metallophosphoesterase [Muribaculaceae bacterium]